MTEAPLLVDVQNDYFSGGEKKLPGMDAVAANAAGLLAAFRESGRTGSSAQHGGCRENASYKIPLVFRQDNP